MSAKPLLRRRLARRDIEAAVDFYDGEAGADVALRFIEAVQAAFRAICARPGAGSPRFAGELDIPGLRSRPVARFPYLIFYVEQEDHIEVWRVLHTRRDFPARLREREG